MRQPRPCPAHPELADPAAVAAAMRDLYGPEAPGQAAEALRVADGAADADQAEVWSDVSRLLRRPSR